MSLLTETSRVAELLVIAQGAMAQGWNEKDAARLVGIPLSTLREWLEQLARAESRQRRRLSRNNPEPVRPGPSNLE